MMANGYFDTKGLFGTTPEELQRKIFDESQLRRAKEMQYLAQGTTAPGYTYGMLQTLEPLRQQFANVGEDPRVTQLREKEAAAQEALAGADISTVEGQRDLLNRLTRVGLYDQAYKMGLIFKQQREATSTGKPFDDEIKVMKDGKIFGQHIKYVDGKPNVVNEWQIPVELTSAMSKILNEAQGKYTEADVFSTKAEATATKLEENPFKGGASKSITEAIKGFTGGRDLRSFLDTEFKGFRANLAVANLPPGSASDADVRLALSGVPPENASSKEIVRWLRAVATAQKKVAEWQRFRSMHISANNSTIGLLKAWEDQKKLIEDQTETAPVDTATTAPAAPQAAPQAKPQPLMPTYEEKGVVNWSDL
jgi:hypothetical protein